MSDNRDNRGLDGNPPFIQEKVLSKKKSKAKKFFASLARTIVLGLFFGLAASMAFCLFRPFFDHLFGKNKEKQKIILASSPSPSPTKAPAATKAPVKPKNTPKPGGAAPTYEASLKDLAKMYNLLADTAAQVNHSIVTVSGVKNGVDLFANPSETIDSSYGLIFYKTTEDFMILTSQEKVAKANKIRVSFIDGTKAEATLTGSDEETGLAVISVPLEAIGGDTLETVRVAALGESYLVKGGLPVLALGNPNGSMYSMEAGMVTGPMYDQYITDYKLDLFHTDICNTTEGEGVITNLDGEVIGVITHKFRNESNKDINTAIGISKLKLLINKMADAEERNYFGIIGCELTEGEENRFPVENGIFVTEVLTKSPAFEAGLQNGDIITKVGSLEIKTMSEFFRYIDVIDTKDPVLIEIVRTSKDNTVLTLKAELRKGNTIIE